MSILLRRAIKPRLAFQPLLPNNYSFLFSATARNLFILSESIYPNAVGGRPHRRSPARVQAFVIAKRQERKSVFCPLTPPLSQHLGQGTRGRGPGQMVRRDGFLEVETGLRRRARGCG